MPQNGASRQIGVSVALLAFAAFWRMPSRTVAQRRIGPAGSGPCSQQCGDPAQLVRAAFALQGRV
jgi:hypothetical protein